jgi:hypothetical protein
LIFEQPGRAEHAIRFAHESGIRLKASFDRLLDDGAIVDLKTARDPSRLGFRRALAEYGYHRQAAIYCQGRDQYVGPRDWPSHYFVVVGNEPPHECAVYIVGQRSLEHGAQQIADLLQRLRDLRDYGVPEAWHGAGHAEPCEIDLPEWEFSREV